MVGFFFGILILKTTYIIYVRYRQMKGQKIELVDIKVLPGQKTFKVDGRKEFKTIKEAKEYARYFYGDYYFLEVWVDGKVRYTSPKYHKTFYPANSFKGSYRSTKWRKEVK